MNADASAVGNGLSDDIAVGEHTGFAAIRPGDLAGFEQLRTACLAIHARRRHDAVRGSKSYLVPMILQEDIDAHPEIVHYALSEALLVAAERYLGAPVVLRGVQLFWTAPTEETAGSQLFHFDHLGERQLKLFAYLNDVDDGAGPLSFLPADLSARVRARANTHRYSDEDVFAICSREDLVVLRGPAGAGGLVDTTRCLHFGGRARTRERLLLMIQYVRPADNLHVPGMVVPTCADMTPLSERQRAAIPSAPPPAR